MNYQGKKLMLVGGGLLQVPAIEIAKSMNLEVIVTDRDPSCICAKLVDEFYAIDTKDIQGHIELAHDIQKGLVGVFTEGASVECTVAAVADALKLPGISYAVANNIANKSRMRGTLSQNTPMKYGIFPDYQSAWEGTSSSPSFIVKPNDGSGSRGMTKCWEHSTFIPQVFDTAVQFSDNRQVLIEELLQPNPNETIWEQSVETVWHDGKGYFLSWVDREFLSDNRYAIESNVYAPATHSPQVTDEVIDMCLKAGKALQMTTGIFKCDTMLTTKGAKILETTARLSGGFDSQYLTPLAYGADYIRGAMLLALGENIHWEFFHPKWNRHAVAHWVFPKQGKVKSLDITQAEKYGKVFARVKVGDEIKRLRACTDRSIVCIADGFDRLTAIKNANRMESEILKGLIVE